MPGYQYKGKKPLRKAADGRNRKVAQCGEYSGYLRHIKEKTEPCLDCRIAYSEYRGYEGRLHSKEAKCGTEPGYKRHRYLKEETCQPCRTAHSQYVTERRAINKANYRRTNYRHKSKE